MDPLALIGLLILTVFYSSFFLKMILLKRLGIISNLLGKGEKPEKARRVELRLKAVTYTATCIQFASLFWSDKIWGPPLPPILRGAGLGLAALGAALFIAAMLTMKNNWRSGYDLRQNTSLVMDGPYGLSRNPAFVGFDLLYAGWALAFPNVVNLAVSILAVAAIHGQILEEELFLENAFGDEYRHYRARVNRYFGRRNRPLD